MASALDIIKSALGKIGQLGAGETPSGDDTVVCRDRLNSLIDSLGGDGFFAYTTVETVVNLTGGDTRLTVGDTMEVDLPRPVKFLPQCFSRLDGRDYELTPVSQEEFNAISLKTLESVAPLYCYYSGDLDPGYIDFWPAPQQTVELHLFTPTRLTEVTNIATDIILPPGYRRYLELALALEIAPDFEVTPTPFMIAMANSAKRAIRKANYKVPQLSLDAVGRQPIFSDAYTILAG